MRIEETLFNAGFGMGRSRTDNLGKEVICEPFGSHGVGGTRHERMGGLSGNITSSTGGGMRALRREGKGIGWRAYQATNRLLLWLGIGVCGFHEFCPIPIVCELRTLMTIERMGRVGLGVLLIG